MKSVGTAVLILLLVGVLVGVVVFGVRLSHNHDADVDVILSTKFSGFRQDLTS